MLKEMCTCNFESFVYCNIFIFHNPHCYSYFSVCLIVYIILQHAADWQAGFEFS